MATKLRRTLYIGLGGTGMSTILRTKKMFMENYGGKVPPMIAFLGLDTDRGVYEKSLLTSTGTEVSLSGSEQCSISVANPRDRYNVFRKNGYVNWMFHEENFGAIQTLDKGAGQVRTNGRLAFCLNYEILTAAIDRSINAVYNVNIAQNELYEVIDSKVEIHIIYSVAGGTGAGTFLDVGYLARKVCEQGNYGSSINGYAVLPSVFKAMQPMGPQMARVQTNGYAALKDLDFLMSLDAKDSEPINLQWGEESYSSNNGPFDSVSIVDNTNINGEKLSHINDISEAISLVLISSAGVIGNETASLMDNVNIQRRFGNFNIENKMGWVSSIGASEIIYNNTNVAQVYAKLAASRIIGILLASNGQANSKANTWIDAEHIRENQGEDQLINHLYDMSRLSKMLDITDLDNPNNEVNAHINAVTNRNLKAVADAKLVSCIASLDSLFKELLNSGNSGVALASETMSEITKQLDIFIGEMKAEQMGTDTENGLEQDADILNQQKDTAVKELQDVAHKFFGGDKARRDAKEELFSRVDAIAANKLEIARRVNAIYFFNSLKTHVESLSAKVATLISRLTNLANKLSDEVVAIQNSVNDNSSFVEIDLSRNIITNVIVDDEDLIIADFIATLQNNDLSSLDTSEVAEKYVLNFTNNLPRAKKKVTVDDALNGLSEEQFAHIYNLAITKASPLLKINDRGYGKVKNNLSKSYFICVPNTATNRITRITDDDAQAYYNKCNNDQSNNIKAISIGLQDKVIIFRLEGAIPAFSIACIDSFKNDYIRDNMAPHFDKMILERMEREDHDFMPKEVDADADALAIWVLGLIYGYIKTVDGVYKFKDWSDTSLAVDDYWFDTKERFRDRAFSLFAARIKNIKEQYQNRIDELVRNNGSQVNNELLSDVKAEGQYLKKYSQCTVLLETMKSRREYQATLELLTREIEFVTNKININ